MELNLDEDSPTLAITPTWSVEKDTNHPGVAFESYHLHVNHNLTDEKGRSVGGHASIHQVAPDHSIYTEGGTKLFFMSVNAARNRQDYGARSGVWSFCATLEQAQSQALLALQRQAKAYQKKYKSPTR